MTIINPDNNNDALVSSNTEEVENDLGASA